MTNANNPLLGAQLRAIVTAFREELKPELSTPQAKLRAELIDMLLSRFAAEAEGADVGEQHWEKLGDFLAGTDATDPLKALADKLRDAGNDPKALDAIRLIAASEEARRNDLEAAVLHNLNTKLQESRSSDELSIPADTFTNYLRKHQNDDSIIVDEVITVPGGRSKGTILLNYHDNNGPHHIVIRRDFSASVTGTSVSYEYPIVRAAWEAGLNVPEPLWLEDDASVIGGRFIAFERVGGKPMGTLFTTDASPGFMKAFAAALAQMHNIDVDQNGLSAKMRYGAEAHPVRAMIDDFYDRYRANVPATPLMDAAFAYLRQQLDLIGNARCIVHGDAGVHNTMGDGDKLTALLDWEFAHVGDPAEDLTYCKYLVERVLPWDEFMHAYIAAGGKPVSAERIRFFTIWRTLHLSIMTGMARNAFNTGRDQDLRIATIGYNTFPKQLRDLAVDLHRAIKG